MYSLYGELYSLYGEQPKKQMKVLLTESTYLFIFHSKKKTTINGMHMHVYTNQLRSARRQWCRRVRLDSNSPDAMEVHMTKKEKKRHFKCFFTNFYSES